MDANGRVPDAGGNSSVLCWQGRLLTAEDLRRSLNGQREVLLDPKAIVTPLARDQLRAFGVQIRRQQVPESPGRKLDFQMTWGYAQDQEYPTVSTVIADTNRAGLQLEELAKPSTGYVGSWTKTLAEYVANGERLGAVVFCQDPGLVCCVANKVNGVRATSVSSQAQAVRTMTSLAPNLVAVEISGRTFFEIRQILRTVCKSGRSACSDSLACTLKELEGNAHR